MCDISFSVKPDIEVKNSMTLWCCCCRLMMMWSKMSWGWTMDTWKPNPYAQPFIPRRLHCNQHIGTQHVRQFTYRRIFSKLVQVILHGQCHHLWVAKRLMARTMHCKFRMYCLCYCFFVIYQQQSQKSCKVILAVGVVVCLLTCWSSVL